MENNQPCSRPWEVYVLLGAKRQERQEGRAGEGRRKLGFDVIGNTGARKTQGRLHGGDGMWTAMAFASSLS